jgi:hypothetical protein
MSFIEDSMAEFTSHDVSLMRCGETSKCREGPEFLSV